MDQSNKIGKRLTTYRMNLEMSVEDLAEKTGLPHSLIVDLEAGKSSPSIGVMVKLSRGLGQRVGTFLDDQFVKDPIVVRGENREEGVASHKERPAGQYKYFSLGAGKADRHMEPFFIKISPVSDRTMSSHEGEEFVIVTSGEVELVYGKETHVLKAGDSMYYNSLVPHCVSAVNGEATIYDVIYTS